MAWVAWVALALTAQLVSAQEPARTVRVTGEGKATTPPDVATINTGVVTQAATAKEAVAANNQAMEQVMAALKQRQIAAKDVQTSSFNVQPMHKHDEQGRRQPEIVGYQVTNLARVKVRQLDNLGAVLDALVQAGSNQLRGIDFGVDDPTKVMDEARKKAIADARRRAELYAQATGLKLGKVQTISEQPLRIPEPRSDARAFGAEMAGSVPVATGEEEVTATIHVVFVLEDAK
jgi:uncharacterized protein YggE